MGSPGYVANIFLVPHGFGFNVIFLVADDYVALCL
jgi:hypothetical protein